MPLQPHQKFPQLDQLIRAYLNQDYELSGDSIEEVVKCYLRDSPHKDHLQLLNDITNFRHAHPSNLDKAFLEVYGFDFDPQLWEISTLEFFEMVKLTLSEF